MVSVWTAAAEERGCITMAYIIVYDIIQKYSKIKLLICSMAYYWAPSSTLKKVKPHINAAWCTYQVHNDWWLKKQGIKCLLKNISSIICTLLIPGLQVTAHPSFGNPKPLDRALWGWDGCIKPERHKG